MSIGEYTYTVDGSIAIGGRYDAQDWHIDGQGERFFGTSAEAGNSIVMGAASHSTKAGTIIMGNNIILNNANAIALGAGTSVTADNAVALGVNSKATEENTVSVGNSSARRRVVNVANGTTATDAATLGQVQTTTAGDYVTITNSTNANGSVNHKISVTANGSVASGNTGLIKGGTLYSETRPTSNGTYVKTGNSTAKNISALDTALTDVMDRTHFIGINSSGNTDVNYNGGGATGSNAIAIGKSATASSGNGVAIGLNASNTANTSVVIGSNASAGNENGGSNSNVVVGHLAKVEGNNGTAVGSSAQVEGTNVTAIGQHVRALANGATAVGSGVEDEAADGQTNKGATYAAGVNSSAFGHQAKAEKDNTTSLGSFSDTKAAYGTAVGSYADTESAGGVAVGYKANAVSVNSIAIGNAAVSNNAADVQGGQIAIGNSASTNGGVAIGSRAQTGSDGVSGGYSVALAADAKALNTNAVAIGGKAVANSTRTVTVGADSVVTGNNSINVGANSKVLKTNSVNVGYNNNIDSAQVVAVGNNLSTDNVNLTVLIGNNAKIDNVDGVSASENVIVGYGAEGYGTNLTAVGSHAYAGSADKSANIQNATAVGQHTRALGRGSVAVGVGVEAAGAADVVTDTGATVASADNSTVVGAYAQVRGTNSSGLGSNANIAGANSVGLGARNVITEGSDYNVVVGYDRNVTNGSNNVLIGQAAIGEGVSDSVAIGSEAESNAGNSVAIGRNSAVDGNSGIAIGYGAVAKGANSVVIGERNYLLDPENHFFGDVYELDSGRNSTAVGAGALVPGERSSALGNDSVAEGMDSVALGSRSVAHEDNVASFGYDAEDLDYTGNPYGEDFKRRLIHVADGTSETDAATVGQTYDLRAGDHVVLNKDGKNDIGQNILTVNVTADGQVAPGNTGLISGGTAYTELRPASDGSYVKKDNTTANNITLLDRQLASNTEDISDLRDMSNLTETGIEKIKELSRDSVDVLAGDSISVSTAENNGVKEFTVSVNADGEIAEDDSHAVSGGTVYQYVEQFTQNMNGQLDGKANVDASNVTDAEAWGNKIATGEISLDDVRAVSGKTIYDELRPSSDGSYIKTDNTTAENLSALDVQVKNNTDTLAALGEADLYKANVGLDNITEDGKEVIRELAKGSVTLKEGDNVRIDKATVDGKDQYTVSVVADGAVAQGDQKVVSGDTVYKYVEGVRDELDTLGESKANTGLDNITEGGKDVIRELAQGAVQVVDGNHTTVRVSSDGSKTLYAVDVNTDGQVASGDNGIVTGDTVYNYVEVLNDGLNDRLDELDSNKANTDMDNLTDTGKENIKNLVKDAVAVESGASSNVYTREEDGKTVYVVDVVGDGTVSADDSRVVSGSTVYKYLEEVASDNAELLDGKANTDASNIGSNFDGTDEEKEANTKAWGEALGTGTVSEGDSRLVSGDTVRVSLEDMYVRVDNEKVDRDLSNLTDAGKDTVRTLVKDTVYFNSSDGSLGFIGTDNEDGSRTYDVRVVTDGKVEKGNDGIVTGGTVFEAVDALDRSKAATDASNIGSNFAGTDEEKLQNERAWADAIGNGTVASGDDRLVKGSAVFNYVDRVNLVKSDGEIVRIDPNGTASSIDISGADGARVLRGVNTDMSDRTSAANVGYVNDTVASVAKGFDRGLRKLDDKMDRGLANAAALAGLHPIDMDSDQKWNVSAALGGYKDNLAGAVGVFYKPVDNVMMSGAASVGNGDSLYNVGVTFALNKSAERKFTKVEMAKVINRQAEEILQLKEQMRQVIANQQAISGQQEG